MPKTTPEPADYARFTTPEEALDHVEQVAAGATLMLFDGEKFDVFTAADLIPLVPVVNGILPTHLKHREDFDKTFAFLLESGQLVACGTDDAGDTIYKVAGSGSGH